MVLVLDENPSFGSQIGRSLGRGLVAGATGGAGYFANKMRNKEENEAIERLTGKNLSGLSPQMRRTFAERLAKSPDHERITEALVARGVDPQDAELYALLTTGGQTAFVKDLLEQKKRQSSPSYKKISTGTAPEEQSESMKYSEVLNPENQEELELEDILARQDEGLTPSERVARGKERYTTGLKVFQEAGAKLRSSSRDKERLDILDKLSNSDKLPKGLARLNVDSEGNLRLPFASSPEAQRYAKTLNEFSSGAKDTFGSRITNFDLSQYLKRFPTLLNSKEGRKQLIQQMKIVNDINAIYYKNLKEIYDKAGGVRNIDADVAESLAERKSEKKISELVQKFETVGSYSSLPSASEFKGHRIQDEETGQILISNGTDWVPEE